MRVHFIHGIHASKPGGNTSQLAPFFRAQGFDTFVHAYGYAFASPAFIPKLVDWQNARRAKRLAARIEDGDVIVCHSNGAAIAYLIQAEHRQLRAAFLINPALDRDTDFHNTEAVRVYYNDGDDVTGLASILPFNHWGSMGKDGYNGSLANVTNIDCAHPPEGYALPPLMGHSAMFGEYALPHWGPELARTLRAMVPEPVA